MTRLKVSLGALMVCAASFAAFGASNAAASTLHQCENTGGTKLETAQRYSDSECKTKSVTGSFQTVPLSAGSHEVTTTGTSDFVLSSAPLGIKNKITCKKMGSVATAINEEVGGKMQVSGGASVTEFSECVVNEPAGCTVAEQPIKTKEITSITEDLAGEVMRTKYTPKTGTELAAITLANCGLLNGKHSLNGVTRSESEGTTTQKFTTTSGSELTFFGAAATLTGTYHLVTTLTGQFLALETP